MSFRYILGLPASGKSFYCLTEILAKQENDNDNSLIYIVPEQYSLQAEYDLVNLSNNKGIMRACVLTFKRLAYRVLSETGFPDMKMMDDTGTTMLLRKILGGLELQYYSNSVNKRGFIEGLGDLIGTFFKYCITPESVIEKSSELADNTTLKMKLVDFANIYQCYLGFLKEHYLSTQQLLDLLAENICDSAFIRGADIWIDSFHSFTPQEYNVITRLIKYANSVTVALAIDPMYTSVNNVLQSDPFFQTKITFAKLNGITKHEQYIKLENNFRLNNDTLDIKHLIKYYFHDPIKVYDETPQNIRIHAASNRYEEIRDVALKIFELVSSGYRYRDIAIVTSSLADYERDIKAAMDQYEIPFFYDSKKEIIRYPLILFVRYLLDIVNTDWSYESVFRYLKTGLSCLDLDDIDLLENYCLAYGIKGHKWKKQWTFGFEGGYENFNEDDINFIKNELVEELSLFTDNIKRSKKYTVRHITTLLVEFLFDLGMYDRLEVFAENLSDFGEVRLAKENIQAWNMLMDIFDKAVEILGDEETTVSEFSKLLNDVFLQNKVGSIPVSIDCVIIGDLLRSRLPEIKVLFIVGANEGTTFSTGCNNALFTDKEADSLNDFGFDFVKNSYLRSLEEQFLFYLMLSKPSKYISISYSLGDIDGKTMYPSMIVRRLKVMFYKLSEDEISSINLVSHLKPTFLQLTTYLRNYLDTGQSDDVWMDVYSWFFQNWNQKTLALLDRMSSSNLVSSLSEQSVKKMYGNNLFSSVSKLERFNLCPFSYFIRYGLKVSERKLYQLQHPDIGTLFHSVLDNFSKKLADERKSWRSLDKESISLMIDDSVDQIAPKLSNEILLSSKRYQYLIKRLKRISSRAIWALAEHIKRGAFEPVAFELGFGINDTLPPIIIELSDEQRIILTGRVDRVDVLKSDGNTFIKIIDYKSGNTKFSLSSIYYGLQLQLMLYLDVLIENGIGYENILPGGVFYFKIDDPIVSAVDTMSEDELEDILLKELKLSGLVLNNLNVITGLDNMIGMSSSIIPVGLKKSDNTPTKNSSVADLDEFSTICSYVNNLIKDIGNKILSGNIEIRPIKDKNISACNYCLYKSICRFDVKLKNNNYRELDNIKNNDIKTLFL